MQTSKLNDLADLKEGGFCLGWSPKLDRIYYNADDTHTAVIGSTRCGKTRCVVLQTIGLLALAGESIIATDPKGELFCYTAPFLRRLGYEIITLDFKDQKRGNRYNFLQPVLDAVYMDDLGLAVSRARDIAQMLVPDEAKSTDPIWIDGQRSAITMGILAVCLCHDDPEQQNIANAYDFVAKLCETVGPKGEIGLTEYLKELPEDHPLIRAMAIARIAPEKMRGSFYTSALSTLQLFTDHNIHDMSKITDFDHMVTGDRKRAIFIILPDEKKTYHPIASLFVYEQYQLLVQRADELGGRLPRRVNFVCDEFGNFVKINDFDSMITVGGGRGIRFHLFLQDFNQIYEKYGERLGRTILSNCETWVYLYTKNNDTRKEISEQLGKYTVKSPSLSGSTGGNSSASYSLTGRELLMPDEIGRLDRPWQLVMGRGAPAILYAPDISKTIFNALYGLGNKKHNQKVLIYRSSARPERSVSVSYWDGWKKYVAAAKAAANK